VPRLRMGSALALAIGASADCASNHRGLGPPARRMPCADGIEGLQRSTGMVYSLYDCLQHIEKHDSDSFGDYSEGKVGDDEEEQEDGR
jgi:hypothetical protein